MLKFDEAMTAIHAGKRVTRAEWGSENPDYVPWISFAAGGEAFPDITLPNGRVKPGGVTGDRLMISRAAYGEEPWTVHAGDLLADDWIVEEIKPLSDMVVM